MNQKFNSVYKLRLFDIVKEKSNIYVHFVNIELIKQR